MTNETSFLRLYGPIELMSSTTSCWNCKKETPVHALAVSDLEDHDGESEPVRIEEPAFVYDLAEGAMPEPLVKALQELAPNYVPTYSGTLGETTWANNCVHC